MKRLNGKELENAARWLNSSPKNTKLETLIIVACMYWFLMFWLIDRIINLRSRRASDVVEYNQGGVQNDEGAKRMSQKNAVGDECPPPSEHAPPHYSHRWDRWIIRKPSPEMVDALVKLIKFAGEHPWAKWPLMLTYTVFVWPILRGGRRMKNEH